MLNSRDTRYVPNDFFRFFDSRDDWGSIRINAIRSFSFLVADDL